MSIIRNLEETLIEKLNEYAQDKCTTEIIIDTFLAVMDAEEWESDDKLIVLDSAIKYFRNGGGRNLHILDALNYENTAIKVNEGYQFKYNDWLPNVISMFGQVILTILIFKQQT